MSPTSVVQFSFVFTAIITVLGWFIVAGQTDRREFRKEVRELVRELRDRLERINQHAAAYWLGTGSTAATAAVSLKAGFLSLSRQIRTLENVGFKLDPGLLAAVRTTATGGDFEKKGRRRVAADKERLVDVASAIEELLLVVDQSFYDMFPPIRSNRIWRFLPLAAALGIGSDGGATR